MARGRTHLEDAAEAAGLRAGEAPPGSVARDWDQRRRKAPLGRPGLRCLRERSDHRQGRRLRLTTHDRMAARGRRDNEGEPWEFNTCHGVQPKRTPAARTQVLGKSGHDAQVSPVKCARFSLALRPVVSSKPPSSDISRARARSAAIRRHVLLEQSSCRRGGQPDAAHLRATTVGLRPPRAGSGVRASARSVRGQSADKLFQRVTPVAGLRERGEVNLREADKGTVRRVRAA